MGRHPDFDRYVAACDYPGVLDEAKIESALREYVSALGIKREIVRIRAGWQLNDLPQLQEVVLAIARVARDAQAALDALAARAARDARDAGAARDARDAGAARDALDVLDAGAAIHRFASWCIYSSGWRWWWDLSWITTTHLGCTSSRVEVDRWAAPLFEAFVAGGWFLFWTETTLYWVAQPRIHIEVVRGARRLHREDGAAVESDVEPLYFWHGVLVPPHAIERPESLTVEEIRNESNAEVRRALRERMGQGRYLREIGAKLIDADYEGAKAGAAPRALLEDDEGRRYLVGTDGSTRRVYYMEIPATSKTCREAHEALCGFTEARIVSKS